MRILKGACLLFVQKFRVAFLFVGVILALSGVILVLSSIEGCCTFAMDPFDSTDT